MSALLPTARKRPPLTANASACGMRASTVYTLALKTTRSASLRPALWATAEIQERPAMPATPRPIRFRKSRRLVILALL